MDKNTLITSILIPIGVTIISSLILSFFKWIKPAIQNKLLSVKEVKKIRDSDISDFVELYNRRINEELRICAEQILEFVDPNPCDQIHHHLYLCKHNGNVVGFIKVIVSHIHNYLFVAYIAIDEKDRLALKNGVQSMIRKVIRKHLKGKKKNLQIFTEIERGDNNGYITALYKNIARRCNSFHLTAYVLDFDYIQPNMPNENYGESKEKVLSLIWIPCKTLHRMYLSKKEVIDYCMWIYNDIYLPSCNCSNNCSSYSKYLTSLSKRYKDKLQSKIKIIKM